MNPEVEVKGVFTLRRRAVGGLESILIGRAVEEVYPGGFRFEPRDYVILVHGYNNAHREARASYARFRGWLEKWRVRAAVLELHWPGDSVFGLGVVSYWRQPRVATKCGALLAKWIEQKAPVGARIVFVGHSMGCRLILETLSRLQKARPQARITGVCLMAAAVPSRMVNKGTLGPAPGDTAEWRILYSRADTVLRFAFPAGQAAGFNSIGTRAVGLHGQPEDVWKGRHRERHEMFQSRLGREVYYEHGYYWPGGPLATEAKKERKASPLDAVRPSWPNAGGSAEIVAKMLGVIFPREIVTKPAIASLPSPPARKMADRKVGGA